MHTSERLNAALKHAPLIPSPQFTYRVIADRWRESPLSAIGSVKRGGRYNLPGTFSVLYTADSPLTAMLEAEALTVAADGRLRGVPRDPEIILTIECALSRVLDLTNLERLAELGTSREELVSLVPSRFILNARSEETPTQRLGAACFDSRRISALMVPSAQSDKGYCLDILLDSLVPGERVSVLDKTGRLKAEVVG